VTTPHLTLPGALPSARRLAAAAAYPVLLLGLTFVLVAYLVAAAARLMLVWP
jgi:hypothetical protein